MPSTTLKDIVNRVHPDYSAHSGKWQFFSDCYESGPDWPSKTNPLSPGSMRALTGGSNYIRQFELESNEAYLGRLSRAVHVNICGPGVDLLAGSIGNDQILLDAPEMEQLIADCDLTGQGLLQFLLDARTQAAVFGAVGVLVDSTRAQAEIRTEADAISQGVRPFLRLIRPLDLLNWRVDGAGRLSEVLFSLSLDSEDSILSTSEPAPVTEYRYWSPQEWKVYREIGDRVELTDEGINPLGEVPLVMLPHRALSAMVGRSLIDAAAKYSVLLSNWLSSMDGVLMMQSFSQAVLLSRKDPKEVGLGASTVVHLNPEDKEDFKYVSPDASPLQAMWDMFLATIVVANQSMGFPAEATAGKAQAESGISRAWRWNETTKTLTRMAVNEQSAVRRIMALAGRWKGMESYTPTVSYSPNFDMFSLEQEISNLLQLQTAGLPPTARREIMRSCVKKSLPSLPPAVEQAISTELDQMGAVSDRLRAAAQE
jgi:hypothetical protein